MLIVLNCFTQLNLEELMQVYIEGNAENGAARYANESEKMQLQLAELDFEEYLRRDFFATANARYYVWEEKGKYISALRLEPYSDGLLLCALETRPGFRRAGYAKKLICAVLSVTALPVYSHISKRNLASIHAHTACGFQKLQDGVRYLDGSVSMQADTYCYRK